MFYRHVLGRGISALICGKGSEKFGRGKRISGKSAGKGAEKFAYGMKKPRGEGRGIQRTATPAVSSWVTCPMV